MIRCNSWSKADEDFLREWHRYATRAELADALGRTPQAIRSRLDRLGLSACARRRFSPAMDDFIRLAYPETTAAAISEILGRTPSVVYQRATRLGLTNAVRYGKSLDDAIHRYHPEGWSDNEIAAVVGCGTKTVCDRRTTLGLPAIGPRHERQRRRVREKTAEQLKAAGVPTLAALRVKVHRERVRKTGWPADLRLRAVQILDALWEHGPMTRRQVAEAVGLPWKGPRKSLCSNDPEGSYLAHLQARGLVLRLRRAETVVSDRLRVNGEKALKKVDVYMLALDAERDVSQFQPQESKRWFRRRTKRTATESPTGRRGRPRLRRPEVSRNG